MYGVVAEAIDKYHSRPAVAVGENSWGDSQLFQDAGFPTLGLGSLGGNFHAPDEWVSISEMETLIKVLSDVIGNTAGKLSQRRIQEVWDMFLGIDLGTSSVKVVLTDSSGNVLGEADAAYPAHGLENGFYEQDPKTGPAQFSRP